MLDMKGPCLALLVAEALRTYLLLQVVTGAKSEEDSHSAARRVSAPNHC